VDEPYVAAFICVNLGPFYAFSKLTFCEVFPDKLFEKKTFWKFSLNFSVMTVSYGVRLPFSLLAQLRYLILVVGCFGSPAVIDAGRDFSLESTMRGTKLSWGKSSCAFDRESELTCACCIVGQNFP
jgi:hypothetical protein